MKLIKLFSVLALSTLINSFAHAASGNIGFYSDHAAFDVQLLQASAAATNGALIFNVQAGPGGRGSDGQFYNGLVTGRYSVNRSSGSYALFTDNCDWGVSVLQGITYSSNGHLVMQAYCGHGGYGSNGEYYSNSIVVNYYIQ